MDQDETLIPEEERKEMIAFLGGKDESASPEAIKEKEEQMAAEAKAEALKNQKEFQAKLNQLKGKSEAEKVMLLKNMINEQ